MDSILTSIKKMLGIAEDYTNFDDELILYINGAFTALNQLGVGTQGYFITSSSNTWSEFLSNQRKYQAAKVDTYLRVRLIFDPPSSGSVTDSINKVISEYDWRLMINSENDAEI